MVERGRHESAQAMRAAISTFAASSRRVCSRSSRTSVSTPRSTCTSTALSGSCACAAPGVGDFAAAGTFWPRERVFCGSGLRVPTPDAPDCSAEVRAASQCVHVDQPAGGCASELAARDACLAQLLALGAELELMSSRGKRRLPLEDFFVHHHETTLAEGEILTRILVPLPEPGTGAAFEKFGLKDAAAVAVASLAAWVRVRADLLSDVRLVMGAVAPTPRNHTHSARTINSPLIRSDVV